MTPDHENILKYPDPSDSAMKKRTLIIGNAGHIKSKTLPMNKNLKNGDQHHSQDQNRKELIDQS